MNITMRLTIFLLTLCMVWGNAVTLAEEADVVINPIVKTEQSETPEDNYLDNTPEPVEESILTPTPEVTASCSTEPDETALLETTVFPPDTPKETLVVEVVDSEIILPDATVEITPEPTTEYTPCATVEITPESTIEHTLSPTLSPVPSMAVEEETVSMPDSIIFVQSLVDALPDLDEEVSLDGTENLYVQTQSAYDAYTALPVEEQALIEGVEKFEQLFAYFSSPTSLLLEEEHEPIYTITIPSVVTLDEEHNGMILQATEFANLTGVLNISVSSQNNFHLISASGASISYTLKNESGIIENNGVAVSFSEVGSHELEFELGSTEGHGLYEDVLTFTVNLIERTDNE